jgi:hypothetical protein
MDHCHVCAGAAVPPGFVALPLSVLDGVPARVVGVLELG